MKRLIFHEILIVSHRERAAFRTNIDQKKTILTGSNRSGKSFLIKCIYSSLGAFPAKMPKEWRDSSPYILLKFSINGEMFAVLLRNSEHIFFDTNDNIIARFPSRSTQLSEFLSGLLNYKINILLPDGTISPVNPYFIFSPFYIDQDTGWNKSWSSFSSDKQSIKKDEIVKFYTGITSEEYYNTLSSLNSIKKNISQHATYLHALDDAFKAISEYLPDSLAILNEEELNEALSTNITECNKLITQKQNIILKINTLNSRLADLHELQKIAQQTLNEVTNEYSIFQSKSKNSSIICPTCLADYETDIAERFNIIHDESRCQDVLDTNDKSISRIQSTIARLRTKLESVSEILQDKLKFKNNLVHLGNISEIISSHSANKLYTITDDLLNTKKSEHKDLLIELQTAETQLNKLYNQEKRKLIDSRYKTTVSLFLKYLGFLETDNIDLPSLAGHIPEMGSSVPRIILAYHYAILHLVFQAKQLPISPIVIDAPNQSAVETSNLKKMIMFIINQAPQNSQVILSTEDLHGISLDAFVINLQNNKSLLRREFYYNIWDRIRYYSDRAPLANSLLQSD